MIFKAETPHEDCLYTVTAGDLLHEYVSFPQIKELEPYVYIYCQNPALEKARLQEMFGSVVVSGEIVQLENKGREGNH